MQGWGTGCGRATAARLRSPSCRGEVAAAGRWLRRDGSRPATVGLQPQGCNSRAAAARCSSRSAAAWLQQQGCSSGVAVGVAAEGCSRGVAADGLLPGCSSWLGRGRRAVGAARARSLSSPPVVGEGGTRRRGPARLRVPGITWKDAGEMRSRLGEIESPAQI